MPTESDLRTWLQEQAPHGTAAPARLDLGSVIRRSRRRRLPRQVTLGGTVGLAAAGIGVASITGIQSLSTGAGSTIASESSAGDSARDESGLGAPDAAPGDGIAGSGSIERAPDYKANLCGGPLADIAPNGLGLELTTRFPARVPANGDPVEGTVVLTNTGDVRVVGVTGAVPAVTLSKDGIVLWHTNGPQIEMAALVDLDPGESMEYPAAFLPVMCSVEDDSAESFREDLPALDAGDYEVSAIIDITLENPPADYPAIDTVTGPLARVSLD